MDFPVAQVGTDLYDPLLIVLYDPIPYKMIRGIQLELPVFFGCLKGEDPGVILGCRQIAFEAGGTLIPGSHGYSISLFVKFGGSPQKLVSTFGLSRNLRIA